MKRIFTFPVLASFALLAFGAEDARWVRDAAISPDGSKIAFSYKGDIFTVPVSGGQAAQITSSKAYDGVPVWTPDGKNIVFMSDREGSDDIFITAATGGTPRRLTTNSSSEKPLTFINESTLLFNTSGLVGSNTARPPFLTQIYSIDVTRQNPRPHLYLSLPVVTANANSKGELLYQDRKGVEDVLRKHERSSGTADVWLYRNGDYTQLTTFNGGDQSPVWGKGDTYYFVSEKDGTLNVYESTIGSKTDKQLTNFTKHPVRSLSSSNNGQLAFTWDGDIYTLTPGSQPKKVNISVNVDNYDNDLVKRYVSQGGRAVAVSPEGNEVALVIRGELYVTNTEYPTTKRITDTSAQERRASFSPDGRSLVFDSDVDGVWQLFVAKIKNPDEKEFAYATDVTIEPLYKCATSAMNPKFSPDGKKVAFLEDRTALKVIDLASKKVTTALDGKYNYSYSDGDVDFEWSPDSRWLLTSYIGDDTMGWNNIDVAIARADGSEVVDLTESGFAEGGAKWVLGGKAVAYSTSKYGMKAHGSWGNQEDIMLMVLDPETWDQFTATEEEIKLAEKAKKNTETPKDGDKDNGKSDKKKNDKKGNKKDDKNAKPKEENKEIPLDLANRRYRMVRLTPNSANIGDFYIDKKGEKLYYVAGSTEGGYNTLVKDLKKGDTKVLLKGISGTLVPDKKGENLFVLSNNGIKKVTLSNSNVKNVDYNALYDRKPSQERAYMFDHMSRQVADKFYDANLHGVDWDYYTSHYREFLPYINNNRDFATLLSEILGELNASHTGGRAYGGGAPMQVASLGAYFDENYDGEGLLVTEIFPRGPLATKKADVAKGDVILAIDGITIEPETDYFPLLEGKAGKNVRLDIKKKNGTKTSTFVKPVNPGAVSSMAYQRWVERNEHIVDSISNGKIGYIHIQGMNTESFNNAYERLLGKYRACDAVVVDTRHNGGGWLHNDVVLLLGGKEYVTFQPRGRVIGHEPFAQWTKPSAMLTNESNYSDAHGTPYAYKALGVGELIGSPVPGTMTAVWWENQIDPSIVFGIPQVTNVSTDGVILENTQLNPDILIYNKPGDIEKGIDAQLEGAVRHLMKKTAK